MACACMSDNENCSIKPFLAASALSERRINSITASISLRARLKPSSIWALAVHFLSSNSDLRVMISLRNLINSTKIDFRSNTLGRPSTNARIFAEKLLCIAVYLYKLFNTTNGWLPPRSSNTILIPFRSDSSLTSVIASNLLVLLRAAMFSIKDALFTWYGSSVTTILSRLPRLSASISAFARTLIPPLPVVYALSAPSVPIIVP